MRAGVHFFAGAACLPLFFTAACRASEPQKAPTPAAPSKASPAASALTLASAARRPEPRCRVLARRSTATGPSDAGTRAEAGSAGVPAPGAALEGRAWLELPEGVELAIKHGATTRELALRGPGRFLPCLAGSETVLVATGGITTTAGPGARAGAEVLLATPFGLVRFSDATLTLEVTSAELSLEVTSGVAGLLRAKPAKLSDAGAERSEAVAPPKGQRKLRTTLDPSALADACREASVALEGTVRPQLSAVPSARHLLGKWSVQHLEARQRARFSCAVARAGVGRLEGAERDRLDEQIARFDHVWQAAETAAPGAGK